MNLTLCAAFLLCACGTGDDGDVAVAVATEAATTAGVSVTSVTRERVTGDVFHHAYVVRLGSSPNAQITIHRIVRERAPWLPRPTSGAAMFLHGDFATFITNFAPTLGTPASTAPGIAPYLAQRNIDVWGFDRRWTQTPAVGGDITDFGGMTVAQEIGDTGTALAFARAIRLITSASVDRLVLAGFSHGGQLAYAYASTEATRPALQRHIKGLIPIDISAKIAPEDKELRLDACTNAANERDAIAAGAVDSDNSFFIAIGEAALAAPDGPSEIFGDPFTNQGAVNFIVGLTYTFFPLTPLYHLASPVLDADGNAASLRDSPEPVIDAWLAGAPFHESAQENADFDALWCNEAPLPVDVPLSRIRVPLLYAGASGGFGVHGLYTTTQVSSTDVTTFVVRRLAPDRENEDFGHGDMLYATDAPDLVWQRVAAWILAH
jgi:pimeloyl-ACP methyl ester carboxylesterase